MAPCNLELHARNNDDNDYWEKLFEVYGEITDPWKIKVK